MNQEEFEKLLPGDDVNISWGKKQFRGVVILHKNYDSDAESETIVVYTGQYTMECVPSQITFNSHNPRIQDLITRSGTQGKGWHDEYMSLKKEVSTISDTLDDVLARY